MNFSHFFIRRPIFAGVLSIVIFIVGSYAFGFWTQWTIMVHGFHWTARIVSFALKLEGSTLTVIMLTWVFVTFRDTSGDILEWVRNG